MEKQKSFNGKPEAFPSPEKQKSFNGGGEEVAGPYECEYYDVEKVRQISRTLLLTLATACVEKTYGDLFKTPLSVVGDVKKDLVEYITNPQSYQSFTPDSVDVGPVEMTQEFLDQFTQSKTNFLSRVSSRLISISNERKEDKIEDFVLELEDTGVWILLQRDTFGKMLLKHFDRTRSSICGMTFQSEVAFSEHRAICPLRPMSCSNEGCSHVFSALHALEHDAVCTFKLVACEQECGTLVIRSNMDRHCLTVCPMKLVKCPFFQVGCSDMLPQGIVEQHCSESTGSHLFSILQIVQKQEVAVSTLTQRVLLLEKALSLSQRSEAVDVGSLTLTVRQQDAKIKALEQETGRLRQELKAVNVSADILQLRRDFQALQKKVGV